MSHSSHSTKSAHPEEHGTVGAYVIGFILSLIFTFVPYYLVVNKVISGTALLATILGIALLQMTVQLVFFLHLGRGPKPLYNAVFLFATAITIVVVIAASLLIMDNLYRTMSPHEMIQKQAQEENIGQIGGRETGACVELRESHIVTIREGLVTPQHVEAERCDTLTFANADASNREINFGVYPESISYGGQYEVAIRAGRPKTITLNEAGSFIFYDSQDPVVGGSFTVSVQE